MKKIYQKKNINSNLSHIRELTGNKNKDEGYN